MVGQPRPKPQPHPNLHPHRNPGREQSVRMVIRQGVRSSTAATAQAAASAFAAAFAAEPPSAPPSASANNVIQPSAPCRPPRRGRSTPGSAYTACTPAQSTTVAPARDVERTPAGAWRSARAPLAGQARWGWQAGRPTKEPAEARGAPQPQPQLWPRPASGAMPSSAPAPPRPRQLRPLTACEAAQ